MKLYHYITKGNTALKDGILSLSKKPEANLKYYYKRSGQTSHEGICNWMENCFTGRSRGIRCFSEPIQWTEHSLQMLKEFIDNTDMFAIDIDALQKDGLLEAIYFSPSVMNIPQLPEVWDCDEVLIKLHGIDEISKYPVDWSICDDELGRRFAYVEYYVLIIKGGIIPPQYITLEAKEN